jgi:hypothetical protein
MRVLYGCHYPENLFRTTQELEFNIRLYDKNSESDFFFPPPKSEYFFQQHWESDLQVKWSVPKWNLRFNSKKSKVMVIGKNLNKNSNWVLGNENIDEVNEYKIN